MTTGLVSQHQLSSYANPQDGQAGTASVVLGNDNTTVTGYNTHDADASIHLQSSVLASRAAAATAGAGAKWLTAETSGTNVRLFYSDGSSWLELNNFGTAATFSAAVTLLAGMTSSATTAANVFIGLGAASAAQKTILASNTTATLNASITTFLTNTGTQVLAVGDSVPARFIAYGASVNSSVVLAFSRGTIAVPTAIQSGDNLGIVRFAAHNSASFAVGAVVAASATQTWTAAAQGAQLLFQTTPNNSVTPQTVLTLGQDASATFAGAVSGITTLAASGSIQSTFDSVTALYVNNAGTGDTGITINRAGGTASNWIIYIGSGSTALRFDSSGTMLTLAANGAATFAGAVSGITTLATSAAATFGGNVSIAAGSNLKFGQTASASVSTPSTHKLQIVDAAGTTYFALVTT